MYLSGSPIKKPPPDSPNRASIDRDASLLEPSFNYLSKFPGNITPQVPERIETPISRALFYTSPDNTPVPQSPQ